MSGYVMTVDSDAENTRQTKADLEEVGLNPEFVFDFSGDPYDIDHGTLSDTVVGGTKTAAMSVGDIIEKHCLKRKRWKHDADSQSKDSSNDFSCEDEPESEEKVSMNSENSEAEGEVSEEDVLQTTDVDEFGGRDEEKFSDSSPSSNEDSEVETQAQKAKKLAFFAKASEPRPHSSFLSMNLSRPVLKALTTMGFNIPTPIQGATIPVALLGKDIVGNAVTGSGKTAAFTIPMVERLLYREKTAKAAAIRCLVLVPTRELAVQCFEVGTKLAVHTDIRFCLVVGGLSLKSQEVTLRSRPDVVIATPGRLIDHIRNSLSFTLDNLDILVLDEADRMLSDGFSDELTEIVKSCPQSRQTMLFSATMTDSVDELVKVSLDKPVRLFVDPKRITARGLTQEFVRVRAGKEAERSALLVALCKRSFKSNVIVFLRSKKLAHQLRIVFGLLGMKADELHGDLSQEQRLQALKHFKEGAVDFLMATDLASRGLDIKGVETVINYDMPGQLAQYLHRVGRTARAGQRGRSVTLVGEADRKMLKSAIKHAANEDQIRHRIVPPDVVTKWGERLEELKGNIMEIMREEKEEKQLRQAERYIQKGQNMLEHEVEIFSRPARTWFQSTKEKIAAKATSKQEHDVSSAVPPKNIKSKESSAAKPKRNKFSGLSRREKRRKMALEEERVEERSRPTNAAIRAAKKAARPPKIGILTPQTGKTLTNKMKRGKGSVSNQDLGGQMSKRKRNA